MQMTKFNGGFLEYLARRGLFRFLRQHDGRQRLRPGPGVGVTNLADGFLQLHIANDHEKDIIGNVFFAVVTVNVIRLEFIEDIRITDDSEAIGTARVSGLEQAAAGTAARIILSHVHFATDDIEFLREFLRRQRRILHDVAEDVDGHPRACVRHVNPINRPVE